MDLGQSVKGSSFVQSLKLQAIRTVKTTRLVSFLYFRQQAFESQIIEGEAKVKSCQLQYFLCTDSMSKPIVWNYFTELFFECLIMTFFNNVFFVEPLILFIVKLYRLKTLIPFVSSRILIWIEAVIILSKAFMSSNSMISLASLLYCIFQGCIVVCYEFSIAS